MKRKIEELLSSDCHPVLENDVPVDTIHVHPSTIKPEPIAILRQLERVLTVRRGRQAVLIRIVASPTKAGAAHQYGCPVQKVIPFTIESAY